MKILGIETSCDDTGVSILEARGKKNPRLKVIANEVSSQVEIHRPYGGVYPSLAKREHQKNLPVVLKAVLKKFWPQEIDAIAVTIGPGLDPCLWVGLNYAQTLGEQWNIPLIPVNHMEGHLLISLLSQRNENAKFQMPNAKTIFPAIALLVSGGHTQLILVSTLGKYKLLGETRDDAAGECFDKTARILGLPYPGGPAIAAAAAQIQNPKSKIQQYNAKFKISLPRPMIHSKDYDFSFSGLKTAVLYDWKSRPLNVRRSKACIRAMAKEIQQAIVDVLISKTLRAAREYNAKTIVLGGGVAANRELREQLRYNILNTQYNMLAAPPALCTDNGLMIALAGYATWLRSGFRKHSRIEAKPNLTL